MGQPIAVVEKPSSRPNVVRFELNRSLTGMGHERYLNVEEASGDRPPDVLARKLIETGAVEAVHIYANVVTVDLVEGRDAHGMLEIIEELFIHYHPGVKPSLP